jgi:hypothetical protein
VRQAIRTVELEETGNGDFIKLPPATADDES